MPEFGYPTNIMKIGFLVILEQLIASSKFVRKFI